MKAENSGLPIPNEKQTTPTGTSKREQGSSRNSIDILFARLRYLEQRVANLESRNSAAQRDIWRIEKKQQSVIPQPSLQEPAKQPEFAGMSKELFG